VHQRVGDGVVVAVELDVIVDIDAGRLPAGDNEWWPRRTGSCMKTVCMWGSSRHYDEMLALLDHLASSLSNTPAESALPLFRAP